MIKFPSSQHNFWTIVLKRIGRRHKRLKFVLKWFDFLTAIEHLKLRFTSLTFFIVDKAKDCHYNLLLSGKTNNVIKDGLKAQYSHSPGQRPG